MTRDESSLIEQARIMAWAESLPQVPRTVAADADVTLPHVFAELPAAPDQLPGLRRQVGAWARSVGFPAESAQDLVLAVDEAASNAVEHAYPTSAGSFTMLAACSRSAPTASVVLSDTGCWRAIPADPGMRGRGLTMMRSLAEVFHLVPTQYGSTVVLGWALPDFAQPSRSAPTVGG
jgi:serine/threonine-protein kinase RsbW